MGAWLRLRRPLAGERFGATAAIWHNYLLGHTWLAKLIYIVAWGWFEWGKSVSGAHLSLQARESRCILLNQSIDWNTWVLRDHVNSLHVLKVFSMQSIKLFHLRLWIHDSLRKLVVFMVNSRGFSLLFRVIERARCHWTANWCSSRKLTWRARPVEVPLFLIKKITQMSVSC